MFNPQTWPSSLFLRFSHFSISCWQISSVSSVSQAIQVLLWLRCAHPHLSQPGVSLSSVTVSWLTSAFPVLLGAFCGASLTLGTRSRPCHAPALVFSSALRVSPAARGDPGAPAWLVPAPPARPLLVIWSPCVVGPCPSSAASGGDPGAPGWLVPAPPARPQVAPSYVLCTHCPLFCADSSSSASPGLRTRCFFPTSCGWFFVMQVFSNVSSLTTVF